MIILALSSTFCAAVIRVLTGALISPFMTLRASSIASTADSETKRPMASSSARSACACSLIVFLAITDTPVPVATLASAQ